MIYIFKTELYTLFSYAVILFGVNVPYISLQNEERGYLVAAHYDIIVFFFLFCKAEVCSRCLYQFLLMQVQLENTLFQSHYTFKREGYVWSPFL